MDDETLLDLLSMNPTLRSRIENVLTRTCRDLFVINFVTIRTLYVLQVSKYET